MYTYIHVYISYPSYMSMHFALINYILHLGVQGQKATQEYMQLCILRMYLSKAVQHYKQAIMLCHKRWSSQPKHIQMVLFQPLTSEEAQKSLHWWLWKPWASAYQMIVSYKSVPPKRLHARITLNKVRINTFKYIMAQKLERTHHSHCACCIADTPQNQLGVNKVGILNLWRRKAATAPWILVLFQWISLIHTLPLKTTAIQEFHRAGQQENTHHTWPPRHLMAKPEPQSTPVGLSLWLWKDFICSDNTNIGPPGVEVCTKYQHCRQLQCSNSCCMAETRA